MPRKRGGPLCRDLEGLLCRTRGVARDNRIRKEALCAQGRDPTVFNKWHPWARAYLSRGGQSVSCQLVSHVSHVIHVSEVSQVSHVSQVSQVGNVSQVNQVSHE